MSEIRTNYNDNLSHNNISGKITENHEPIKDLSQQDVEIEVDLLVANESGDPIKVIKYLMFLLDTGKSLKTSDGVSINKEMLTKVVSLMSSSTKQTSDTEKNSIDNFFKEITDNKSINEKTGNRIIKDTESSEPQLFKNDVQNSKDSNLGKTILSQVNDKSMQTDLSKTQTDNQMKANAPSTKVIIEDNTVTVHSLNGQVSTDDGKAVAVKGTPLFLDGMREVAHESGFTENNNNQSKDQENHGERNKDEDQFETTFVPGD